MVHKGGQYFMHFVQGPKGSIEDCFFLELISF